MDKKGETFVGTWENDKKKGKGYLKNSKDSYLNSKSN